MRTALLALLATLGGCLFVDGVNEPPTATLGLVAGSTLIGSRIDLLVTVHDDQAGATSALTIFTSEDRVHPVSSCVAQPSIIDGGWDLVFWKADTYVVVVTPTDRYGAIGSTASASITVGDSGPSLPQAKLSEGSPATACGANWIASAPIPIVLPEPAFDPDASLDVPSPESCDYPPSQLTYAWQLTSQPTGAGTLGLAVVTNDAATCPATPKDPGLTIDGGTTVCLYPDPSIPATGASTYGVSLVVSTAVGATSPIEIGVLVLGDAPACLDGSYPSAGSYVVPSDEATVFEVVGADDVSAPSTLLYTWTVTRSDGTSTVVQPATDGDDDGARLSLDPVALGVSVGETLRLRAEVVEPGGTAPSCADSDDTCAVSSCVAASSTCPTRATWTLEYR